MLKDFFFDYFYYKLYKLNPNEDYRGFLPVVVITGIQFLFSTGLGGAIARLFLDREVTAPYAKTIATVGVVFLLVVLVYNYKKYSGRFHELDSKWKNETRSERIVKGGLIIATIVLAFLPSLIVGILF